MKIVYLVKKNPEMPAKEDNWIVMDSHGFGLFKNTEEGIRRRKDFCRLSGFPSDDVIIAECDNETAKQWRAETKRSNYLRQMERERGYIVFSYHGIQSESGEAISGEDILEDEAVNVEESAIAHVMQEKVRNALTYLSEEDKDLIEKLFLSECPMTEREYAERLGKKTTTIHERKKRILSDLRELLKK